MVSIGNILTITGIIIQTGVLFWIARDVFKTFKQYYDKEIMRNTWMKEEFKKMKKEQIPLLITLSIASTLQIIGLLL